jgi:superfamily II DNA/RNA helicase
MLCKFEGALDSDFTNTDRRSFKAGRSPILIATGVSARGLDVKVRKFSDQGHSHHTG